MNATAQMPEQSKVIFRFTPANAREMAARSAVARKQAAALPPLIPSPSDKSATPMPTSLLDARTRRIEAMITQTEEAYARTKDAREMHALAMALDKLYGTWSLLTGHERPGVRKTRRNGRQMPGDDGLNLPDHLRPDYLRKGPQL